jgi:predicted permease
MGIPLALFAFGQAGLQRATLMICDHHFSAIFAGNLYFKRPQQLTEIFRLPLIYAALAGLSVNLAQISLPEVLLRPINYARTSHDPIMLISLGYRLHEVESLQWGHALGGAPGTHWWRLCCRELSGAFDRRRRRQPSSPASLRRPAGSRRQLRF